MLFWVSMSYLSDGMGVAMKVFVVEACKTLSMFCWENPSAAVTYLAFWSAFFLLAVSVLKYGLYILLKGFSQSVWKMATSKPSSSLKIFSISCGGYAICLFE